MLIKVSPFTLTGESLQRLAGRADEPTLEGVGGAGGSAVLGCGFETHQSGSEAHRRKGGQGRGVLGHSRRGLLEFGGCGAMGFRARGCC